jgi:hypothetical protein
MKKSRYSPERVYNEKIKTFKKKNLAIDLKIFSTLLDFLASRPVRRTKGQHYDCFVYLQYLSEPGRTFLLKEEQILLTICPLNRIAYGQGVMKLFVATKSGHNHPEPFQEMLHTILVVGKMDAIISITYEGFDDIVRTINSGCEFDELGQRV